MELEGIINKYNEKLNENDLIITSYILKNKKYVQNISLTELAQKCHTSKSTVLRLTQKIGFTGFTEFKFFLRQSNDNIKNTTKNAASLQFEDVDATIKLIKQADYNTIVDKMYKSERIFGYGTGWGEKNTINELSRNLMSCGAFLTPIPAKTEFDWNIESFTEKDFIIIASYSGETIEIKQNIKVLNIKNIPVLSITTLQKNYIASFSTYNLYYQVTPILLDYNRVNEMNSFITLNLVGDALFRAYADYYTNMNGF